MDLKRYEVTFFNRFANQTQTFRVMAKNEFRAGRLFYIRYNRRAYKDCIESICEVRDHYWTEEELLEWKSRKEKESKDFNIDWSWN